MSSEQYLISRKNPAFLIFAAAAARGDIAAVKRRFTRQGHYGHPQSDAENLVVDIIAQPHLFRIPRTVLGILENNHVNFANAFKRYAAVHNRDAMKDIWTMYSRSPLPQIVQTAGVLLTEALSSKLMENLEYKCDVRDLFAAAAADDKKSLPLEAIIATSCDSIIVTQNAMVDYVRDNGGTLPLNRGAAMLAELTNDVSQDVSALWTRRMTDIESVTRYDSKHGDIQIARAVYAPSGP